MGGTRQFYDFWTNFSSKRDFSAADKWKLADADNRQIRRLMEKENRKVRNEAKRKFNLLIRRLAEWVKKHYPRVVAHNKAELKRKEEEKAKRQAEKEEREARMAKVREAEMERFQQLRAEEESEQESTEPDSP